MLIHLTLYWDALISTIAGSTLFLPTLYVLQTQYTGIVVCRALWSRLCSTESMIGVGGTKGGRWQYWGVGQRWALALFSRFCAFALTETSNSKNSAKRELRHRKKREFALSKRVPTFGFNVLDGVGFPCDNLINSPAVLKCQIVYTVYNINYTQYI